MKVKILSLSEAMRYQTNKKVSIIRIGDEERDFPNLPQTYKQTCTLKFYDIEPKPSLPSNWNWFNETNGESLLQFFKALEDNEELIIHCHAGVSRSPAVALSYAWFKRDKELEDKIKKGKYLPNAQVLKVMAKLIGIYTEKEEFIRSYSRLE